MIREPDKLSKLIAETETTFKVAALVCALLAGALLAAFLASPAHSMERTAAPASVMVSFVMCAAENSEDCALIGIPLAVMGAPADFCASDEPLNLAATFTLGFGTKTVLHPDSLICEPIIAGEPT